MKTEASAANYGPGTTLENGAVVIADAPGERDYQIVLCLINYGPGDYEYATWSLDPETGDCYWGHYHHHDLFEAVADFKERMA